MRIERWNVDWRTVMSNASGGLVVPLGPWRPIAGLAEGRAYGELRANTGSSTPTVQPGIQFANFENTPITEEYLVSTAWTPPGFNVPDTITPWAALATTAGKYLLGRPVAKVSSATLHAVALSITFELRFE